MAVLASEGYTRSSVSRGSRRHVAVQRATRPRRTAEEALRRPPRAGRVAAGLRLGVAACTPRRMVRQWPLFVAVAVAVAGVVVAFGMLLGSLSHGVSAEVPADTAVVSVARGETLWDVAAKYAPESDPRAVVERIKELNGVTAADVAPGYALTVPVQSRG